MGQHDRVALVTGASSGIGRAVVDTLVARGMRVAACARRPDRLEQLTVAYGERVLAVPADLRDEAAIHHVFRAIAERWGGVDVLVNNAGLGHASGLSDGTTAVWREILDVNVLALAVCTREALRQMRERGVDGHIVNVSSMAGHRVPGPAGAMYSASKHAVRALTEALRQELREAGSRIRASSISPGLVDTEFQSRFSDGAVELSRDYPILRASDVAEAVRWVLEAPAHVEVHDVLLRPTCQPR